MDIISDTKINYTIARSKFNNIIEQLGTSLRIPKESISILKPLTINKGINIKFVVNSTTYRQMHNDSIQKNDLNEIYKQIIEFEQILNDTQHQTGLISEICNSWKISSNISINNINISYKESKNRRRHTVEIQLQSVTNNYNKNNAPTNGHNKNNVTMSMDNEGNLNSNENDLELEGDNVTSNNNITIHDIDDSIDTQNDNAIANQLSQHYNDINNVTNRNDINAEGN